MPIYAYKCESCGFAKDVLQKISDAPLSQCPACETASFRKQLTAAGFQLKGSGWYVTDFRDGNKGNGKAAEGKPDEAGTAKSDTPQAESKGEAKADSPGPSKAETKTETKTETKSDKKPAATAPAKAATTTGTPG